MKRILVAVMILTVGGGLFGSLRVESNELGKAIALTQRAVQEQQLDLETAQAEHAAWQSRMQELRHSLRANEQPAVVPVSEQEWQALLSGASPALTPEQRERLLAELGLNWNTMGEFLVVTKETLRRVSLNGMRGTKPTDAADAVLALSATERSVIESAAQQISDAYAAWMRTSVKRTGAEGTKLCAYEVTLDETYTHSASNLFTTAIFDALGNERGELFSRYANAWMRDMGMLGVEPTTLTINQPNKDKPYYLFTIKSAYSSMTTTINPWQPFPQSFHALFPKGWQDLARVEGFELPAEFKQRQSP